MMQQSMLLLLGAGGHAHEALVLAVDAHHRLSQVGGDLGQDLGVVVVRHGLDDGAGAGGRVSALEDSGADKDAVHAHLQRNQKGTLPSMTHHH